jgi:hypothetical protein
MKKMKGDIGIKYKDTLLRVINNNYRNIICIVAPFKDGDWVFKAYNSLKEAVDSEKTNNDEVTGYSYLERLYKHFPDMPEIVLCNITTVVEEELDYNLSNEQLALIFDELDEVGISLLAIPQTLTIEQYVMYKTFYDEQKEKMNRFGLIHQVLPTSNVTVDTEGNTIPSTPLLTVLDKLFRTGGSWFKVTTPEKFPDEDPLSLEETVIYYAGLLSSLPENVSLTYYVLDGVEGLITKEEYGKEIFDLINNSGAIAVNYRDKIHKIVQIYNSGTSTYDEQIKDTIDLKHERVTALISNEMKIGLLELLGDDNDQVSYDDFESLARGIRDRYKNAKYITGLDWKIDKNGSAQILVPIQDKQRNIIGTIDVTGATIIE